MPMSIDEEEEYEKERQVTKKMLMSNIVRKKLIKLEIKVRKFYHKQMHSN